MKYTDITFLVDRSGSMTSMKDSMEQAFDAFLEKHKQVPSTRITLVQFDGENDQEVIYTALPVRSAERLVIRPRGWTPLVDAFVKLIDNTGKRLNEMPERERPDQVLFVVITDGQENASIKYNRHDVHQRVAHQKSFYNWQFVYLGANQDAIREAHSYGIRAENAITYKDIIPMFVGENASLVNATLAYVNRTTSDVAGFTDEDRTRVK